MSSQEEFIPPSERCRSCGGRTRAVRGLAVTGELPTGEMSSEFLFLYSCLQGCVQRNPRSEEIEPYLFAVPNDQLTRERCMSEELQSLEAQFDNPQLAFDFTQRD